MSERSTVFSHDAHWEADGTHRIPFSVYTSDEPYKRELERFFYKGHWCCVGLETEVREPGNDKRTVVGERSVIMVLRRRRRDQRRRERLRAPGHALLS